jgi:hypothetical protein
MKLTAHFNKTTMTPEAQRAIEHDYATRLVDRYGSVEAAYKSKENWHRQGEPPFHAWINYNDIVFDEVTWFMNPLERNRLHPSVKFEQ